VATVVAKLFNAVKPHIAVFGQKDYQQLTIIERMVKDLNMDVQIIPHPTVREKSGLAMSSRNTYLSSADRDKALLIYASIRRLQELVNAGERDSLLLKDEARRLLTSENGVDIEYVSISNPETLAEVDFVRDRAVYAVAVRVGTTRLIDNAMLGGEGDTEHDEIKDPPCTRYGEQPRI